MVLYSDDFCFDTFNNFNIYIYNRDERERNRTGLSSSFRSFLTTDVLSYKTRARENIESRIINSPRAKKVPVVLSQNRIRISARGMRKARSSALSLPSAGSVSLSSSLPHLAESPLPRGASMSLPTTRVCEFPPPLPPPPQLVNLFLVDR